MNAFTLLIFEEEEEKPSHRLHASQYAQHASLCPFSRNKASCHSLRHSHILDRSCPDVVQHRLFKPRALSRLRRDGDRGDVAACGQAAAGEVAGDAVRLGREPWATCADGKNGGRGIAQRKARRADAVGICGWCTGAFEVGRCCRRRKLGRGGRGGVEVSQCRSRRRQL